VMGVNPLPVHGLTECLFGFHFRSVSFFVFGLPPLRPLRRELAAFNLQA
jgi:hypothetical protein